jgi:transcriptional regulator with XRE-family HTH domain
VTFKDALQTEIDLQGLSVAQIAQDSSVSKGAIYNILNGTTEDARIRPATRKALAAACNRDVRPDGDGVVFVESGAAQVTRQQSSQEDSVVLSWLTGRSFLTERHASAAFDWLHAREEVKELSGLHIVDRVYQNRADFLSLALNNKGAESITTVSVGLTVHYRDQDLSHSFSAGLSEPCAPGEFLEQTVFVCVGEPYSLSVEHADLTSATGAQQGARLPDPFHFDGGHVD